MSSGNSADIRAAYPRFAKLNPAIAASLAYGGYAVLGALVLMLPAVREAGKPEAVGFIDALFLSMSAVSTTGLVTLDPGTTFNIAGELTLLVLIQVGGVGYMTFMSFAYLVIRERLTATQAQLTRSAFGLPERFRIGPFVSHVVIATLAIEATGAVLLAILFSQAGVDDPVWNGIFHSVSAFCTAGFSLFANSFENFKDDWRLLLTVSVLSYLGAFGFVVLSECFEAMVLRPRRLSVTTRATVSVSLWLLAAGTVFVWVFEPSIRNLPVGEQFSNAFFQVMTASTTVGFNSVPIGAVSAATVMVLYLLMFVGASPAGTGGGLKSTTAAMLASVAWSSITGREDVRLFGYIVPGKRVLQSAGTIVIALMVIFMAVTMLDLTGSYQFDRALFEVISALATVGLSMGITGELNDAGKIIIIAVMLIGRVGILTFFAALALGAAQEESRLKAKRDVIL